MSAGDESPVRTWPRSTRLPTMETMAFSAYGAEIYARGQPPDLPTDPGRLEEAARAIMTETAFWYVAGGAGSGGTPRANRAAFDRYGLGPRMLRDTTVRDWATPVLPTAA